MMYKKVPLKSFINKADKKTVKEHITVRMNTTFGVAGSKKLIVKLFNDTYLIAKDEVDHLFFSKFNLHNLYS